jgi:hypothetical protein
VPTRLSLDRFEGKSKEIAVLTLTLERDAAASRQVAQETRRVQDKLSERDPGGDIKL